MKPATVPLLSVLLLLTGCAAPPHDPLQTPYRLTVVDVSDVRPADKGLLSPMRQAQEIQPLETTALTKAVNHIFNKNLFAARTGTVRLQVSDYIAKADGSARILGIGAQATIHDDQGKRLAAFPVTCGERLKTGLIGQAVDGGMDVLALTVNAVPDVSLKRIEADTALMKPAAAKPENAPPSKSTEKDRWRLLYEACGADMAAQLNGKIQEILTQKEGASQ